jgi:general secretion pathway protein A
MYKDFFGLREDPFRTNPDPRYLFQTPNIQEALASLAYGIRNRCGIILMTGEVGTGKTTLLHALLDGLRRVGVATAFIFNTRLSVQAFFAWLMADFGIPGDCHTKEEAVALLHDWLLDRFRADQTAVLIVDEAQNLSIDVLEELRLLTNLQTSTRKLLQIVLSGQPDLEEKLKRPEGRQLRQRITVRCRTRALSSEETQGFILKRLQVAGVNCQPIFSPEAITSIYSYSQGIPRVINILCEHALIHAFADQMRRVSAAHVAEVAREFEIGSVEWAGSPTRCEVQENPDDGDASWMRAQRELLERAILGYSAE